MTSEKNQFSKDLFLFTIARSYEGLLSPQGLAPKTSRRVVATMVNESALAGRRQLERVYRGTAANSVCETRAGRTVFPQGLADRHVRGIRTALIPLQAAAVMLGMAGLSALTENGAGSHDDESESDRVDAADGAIRGARHRAGESIMGDLERRGDGE